MKILYKITGALVFFVMSCNGKVHDRWKKEAENDSLKGYHWEQLTANAAFPKSYNFQMFSIRDTLWIIHHTGTWYSLNGKAWESSSLANVLKGNAFLDYVWFKGALYALGTFEGNAEQYKFTSAIHRTVNMKAWEVLAMESNLPRRFFYHPFVFNDKIWIIGGNDGGNNFSDDNNLSDIWNSTDGVQWIKQADNLPFGKRENSQFVLFKNKIYMLNYDVWSSSDGINWKKVIGQLANERVFGYAPVVYDNKIWLLGCNRDGVFQSQVLVSDDGEKWQTTSAPWTPRGAATACVHKGRVILTSGKYGGLAKDGHTSEFVYSNDVWSLNKDE